jgi:4-hydroxybenzoate polyprenyltransferase
MNPYLKILRPKSWLKNLLVFFPFLLFGSLKSDWLTATIAFVLLCIISSVTYIVNDIIDMKEDRRNGKNRPLATGKVSPISAIWIIDGLLWALVIIVVMFNIPRLVVATCLVMMLIDIFYIWKLRNIPVADIISIALKYPLRLFIGFAIIGMIDYLLLLLVYLIALSLAIMKRKGEWLSGMKRKVFTFYNSITIDWMFIYTFIALNVIAFVSLLMTSGSFIVGILSIVELYFVARYYFDIKGYEEAKSLAVLKDKKILIVGLAILVLMILKINGVSIIV